jgi:hypothetical protein
MAGAGGKSGTSLAWIYFNRPTSLRLQGPDHFAERLWQSKKQISTSLHVASPFAARRPSADKAPGIG